MANTSVALRKSALVLMPESIDQAMRLADLMARNDCLPDCLREKPGNCLMVIEQAMRWGMSPYAVAQCTFVYQGKLGYEGKLVHAAIDNSGVITADGFKDVYQGSYDFQNPQNTTRKIVLSAQIVGESERREVEVKWVDAYTTSKGGDINKQWRKMPDQMLFYAATRIFVRRYKPAVLLGVYTREEVDHPEKYGIQDDGPVIDGSFADDEGSARDRVDAAVLNVGKAVEAHKVGNAGNSQAVARVYPINTMRFSRTHSKAEAWIEDWRKYVAGCVAGDALDGLSNTFDMNLGSFEEIAAFDWEARNQVAAIIQNGVREIKEKRQAAADKQVDSQKEKQGHQPPAEDGPPDDGAPPNDGDNPPASASAPQDGPPPAAASQGDAGGNAPHAADSVSQPPAASEKPAAPVMSEADKQSLRKRADSFITKLADAVAHEERTAMFEDKAAERICAKLLLPTNCDALRTIRQPPCEDIYKRLLAACNTEKLCSPLLRELEAKNGMLYGDLLEFAESQRVPA